MRKNNLAYLRKKYPQFVYESYSYKISRNNLEIFFHFRIVPRSASRRTRDNPERSRRVEPDIKFTPKIIIKGVTPSRVHEIGERVLNNLIFHIGLIEIPSYWKPTCSPEILIKAGALNREQINWWKGLVMQGMGEFFYKNRIDFRKPKFLKISSVESANNKLQEVYDEALKNRVIIPIGGGKDSVVALEILKNTKEATRSFLLNPNKASSRITEISGEKNPIIIWRKLDKKLLELNKQGYLNGHTPFSALLAFLAVFCAVIFDYKYIAFSNEKSSNEGNVKYLGKIINHQWSKSFEFEQKFRDYSRKYLSKNVEYFSFLRPLYEFQIAKLFSQYPKYFSSFMSCNNAFKTYLGTKKPIGKWCGNCPKCLFIFMALYPFLNDSQLLKIFGQNLFDKKELLPILKGLIGEMPVKPFECVGTRKESLIALYLGLEKANPVRSKLPKATAVPPVEERTSNGAKKTGNIPFLLKYFQNSQNEAYRTEGTVRNPSEAPLSGAKEDKMFSLFKRSHEKLTQLNMKKMAKEAERIMNSWDKGNNLPKKFEKILKASLR